MALKYSSSRAANAVVAAFVADSATLPVHWIYDPQKIKDIVSDHVDSPEFHEPISTPFYNSTEFPGHYTTGSLSPYAEQGVAFLEHLSQEGELDGDKFASFWFKWAQEYTGRHNHSTTDFMAACKKATEEDPKASLKGCGADDSQADCFLKIAPLAALYAGRPEYIEKCTEAIKVHQNNDLALTSGLVMAYMLEHVVMGGTVQEGFNIASEKIKDRTVESFDGKTLESSLQTALDGKGKSGDDFLASLGEGFGPRSCALPSSLMGALQSILTHADDDREEAFEKAVRDNLFAAGDNCSRVAFIAACLGASCDRVPEEWEAKYGDHERVREMAVELTKKREALEKVA